MNAIDLYICKKISENELLKYLKNYFSEEIASLNNLENNAELFLQYNDYSGDVNVGITISWPLNKNKNIDEKKTARDLANHFQTSVLLFGDDENDEDNFNCIDSNGIETIVTVIDDEEEDAIYIDRSHSA